MKEYFNRLFSFNNWANQVLSQYLVNQPIQDEQIVRLASHLVHAQANWYKRVIQQQADYPVWNPIDLDRIPFLLAENGRSWLEYVAQLEEGLFKSVIQYNNLAGQLCVSTVEDILVHVVNHATYHRGQVVWRIRELDFVPPSTDYIIFSRL